MLWSRNLWISHAIPHLLHLESQKCSPEIRWNVWMPFTLITECYTALPKYSSWAMETLGFILLSTNRKLIFKSRTHQLWSLCSGPLCFHTDRELLLLCSSSSPSSLMSWMTARKFPFFNSTINVINHNTHNKHSNSSRGIDASLIFRAEDLAVNHGWAYSITTIHSWTRTKFL